MNYFNMISGADVDKEKNTSKLQEVALDQGASVQAPRPETELSKYNSLI
jgi:hypothetical protein